jgi:hypothetical protein
MMAMSWLEVQGKLKEFKVWSSLTEFCIFGIITSISLDGRVCMTVLFSK